MKIQLALDMPDLKEAISIAKKTHEHVDIIEIGTPLLKKEGVRAISEMRKLFPGKKILADTKTADTALLEAEIMREAGADYFTVLASAPEETLKNSLKAGIMPVVDLIGIKDKKKRIAELDKMGFAMIVYHTGIDEGKTGSISIPKAKTAIAVAGGLNPETIKRLKPEIAIVGRCITKSENPKKAAKEVFNCV